MAARLAILAGSGSLPVEIAQAYPDALKVGFEGVSHGLSGDVQIHAFEKLGTLFDDLRRAGVGRVVLAGSMTRPPLRPEAFDAVMQALAPRLVAAMQGGDDALLRLVIDVVEEHGFSVLGAHELLPQLTAQEGVLAGAPSDADLADADRAADILLALSPVDVGQGAVVAGGLCLAVECIQGTDFMLETVARTPAHLRRGAKGVLVKAAKRGQDLRVDMPAIGPETIARVAAAGLAGLVIEAAHVLVLERAQTLQAAEKAGVFLMSRVL